ncbi:MAG: hypothetical protein RQ758_07435 [Methanomicrobiaceae archaeon]|nr:hypothetical protein [Methanomicrobiaceae archaeon]
MGDGGFTWAISLETVLEETGELEHLHSLIQHRARLRSIDPKDPEVTGELVVEEVIGPVLDELEAHLRAHLFAGMLPRDVKILVHDWIEEQINL